MRSRKCTNCEYEFEVINITPIKDSNRHSEHHDCHCNPKTIEESGCFILVHNSFDGREGIEWANEILKQ